MNVVFDYLFLPENRRRRPAQLCRRFSLGYTLSWTLLLLVTVAFSSCTNQPERVLIFSKTAEFRHNSIEAGVEAIQQMLEGQGILVDATEDAAFFTEDSLRHYSAVIFLSTTGNVLNNAQQADFERYIQVGGGFVGIHAATDTEYDWPWYNQLVGAYFNGHPAIQEAKLKVVKQEDPSCQHLPVVWPMEEEWYNFRSINPEIEVLVEIDESSYEGGIHGENHPMVWKHHYDGGRSFYTAIGHKGETYSAPLFLQQIMAGIDFAMGENIRDYSKATTPRVPEENRFNKRVLDFNLDEPMELEELGERGILFIERRGVLKLYEYETAQTKVLDTLDVHYADEDGLLGVAVDPNFTENSWIYLFYSPNAKEAVQHVSRFTLDADTLAEEHLLLEIPLIRKCCHSGGSLEFGADGLLYIGVGDNTNPFESDGFAPIDERAGRRLFDAQRSAANTNDLRGKILRIQPEADGTYSIPEGNLFPEGTENCRPEIYVMGCRNPFRFSIDSKTNFLYWGDVGPDAPDTDTLRGPMGIGEFNQAQQPGFYGWPYSRGNNQMYNDFDFRSETSGPRFDPTQIRNTSPNNTGLQELPPIQESMIWYSYRRSPEFPWLGVGGVNPMSGPIYHSEDYADAENAFPAYFDNKWLVYEWMRDWIYVVHLDEKGDFVQADPFLPNTEFSHPMDMLFSKDGKLYVLEYGQKWNSQNLDARLSVVEYNAGNRPPVARFEVDREAGAVPFTAQFSAEESMDYDQDEMEFSWSMGGVALSEKTSEVSYTFETPGVYEVELTVTDSEGNSASSSQMVMAGNEPPKLTINLSDTNTTYGENKEITYEIEVADLEDGSTADGSLDPSKVKVTFNYIPQGEDIILASIGHQQNVEPRGLELINGSYCRACHAIDEKVAGPSYRDVAIRYEEADRQQIIHRIVKGSQGVWGEQMMAPHPQLQLEEVEEMVTYILSLDPDRQMEENLLPLAGTLRFDQHAADEEAGKYILMASYLDEGQPEMKNSTLSAVEQRVFIPPRVELEDAVDLDRALAPWQSLERTVVGSIKDGKHIQIAPIEFRDLGSVSIGAVFSADYEYEGVVEIRKGAVDGPLLGSHEVQYFDEERGAFEVYEIALEPATGIEPLFLVFSNDKDEDQYVLNGDWLQLNYK